jgi:HAD superfamily hydrolase (TIGR01509 family)
MNLIFDLDGVLLDTEKYYVDYWMEAARSFGYRFTRDMALGFRSLDHGLSNEIFKSYFGEDADVEAVRAKRIELMSNIEVVAKPYAKEIAEYVKSHHISHCICTSSSVEKAAKYLEIAGLSGLFDRIISAKGTPRGKPFPDPYLKACSVLGIEPKEAICVEDSPNGFQSAVQAGCQAIFAVDLTEPTPEIASRALAVIHSLSELPAILESHL